MGAAKGKRPVEGSGERRTLVRGGKASTVGSDRPNRTTGRVVGVVVIVSIALSGLAASTAHASFAHVYNSALSSSLGSFSGPQSVAVDQSSGDIYVTDSGNSSVKRFTSAGAPASFSALGTNEITASGPGNGPSAAGFSVTTGVAVDAAGNFYVNDYGNKVVNKFDSAGNFLLAISPDLAPNTPGMTVPNTPSASFGPSGIAVRQNTGHVYVGDATNSAVDEFDPNTGAFVSQYGNRANPGFFNGIISVGVDNAGNVYGIDAFNGRAYEFSPSNVCLFDCNQLDPGVSLGVTVSNATNNVYVANIAPSHVSIRNGAGGQVEIFGAGDITLPIGIAVNDTVDTVYVADRDGNAVRVFDRVILPDAITQGPANVAPRSATLSGHIDPAGGGDVNDCHFEYGTDTSYGSSIPCSPAAPFSGPADVTADLAGLELETTYHYRLVATNANGTQVGEDATFTTLPAVADLVVNPPSDVTETGLTLNGSLDPKGLDTHFYFEYGTDASYGSTTAVPPGADAGSANGPTPISAAISGLQADNLYHYRLVATNSFGVTVSPDQTVRTARSPTVDGFSAINQQPTSADLTATINPHGADTTYFFEYGETAAYGKTAPIPPGEIPSGMTPVDVSVHIDGLARATTHFRVVAKNVYGTKTTDDKTFDFYPPNCPNAHVRQETGSNYLPDCRAYELVSPANAGGTSWVSAGPWSPHATNPARLAFTGRFSAPPGLGDPITTNGDLYVATRTSEGWTTKYVGLAANQASLMGGPPVPGWNTHGGGTADRLQSGVFTDPGMDTFANWRKGNAWRAESNGFSFDDGNRADLRSNSPYVWNADGELIDRWPTNLHEVPGGDVVFLGNPDPKEYFDDRRGFAGAVAASGDLEHFVFSSRETAYAPGGLTEPPGSAYDNDVVNRTVTIVSKTAAGADISQEPSWGDATPCYRENSNEATPFPRSCEWIRFPGVSTDGIVNTGSVSQDGSHILMSTATAPLCVHWGQAYFEKCQDSPERLYMRVNNAVSYEVSQGHAVSYVGMVPDGSRVFFTSPEQLTADDHDASVDLFAWNEPNNTLTRLSVGSGGSGDSDACSVSWASGCGIETVFTVPVSYEPSGTAIGGNGSSDNPIADDNGDIYFYSPEQLDGAQGVPGQRNLYVHRSGHSQYVATFDPERPIVRIQVTPNDRYAAFLTASKVTSNDNAGFLQMYLYDVVADVLKCISCPSDGSLPNGDTWASFNGLFMTDDGRPFFSSMDGLEPQDTNGARDVYEYIGGRPRLISSGTGPAEGYELEDTPGLYGVSANGTDVYFTSLEKLVGQDQNGRQLKIYDARTNGGFPFDTPPPPCAAADECHGPGNTPPLRPAIGSGAYLGSAGSARHRAKKHHRKKGRGKKARPGKRGQRSRQRD